MREMKRNIFAIVVMAILLALGGTAQAVSYKGAYKGRSSQPAYMAPATVPVVTFQSTSAYSGQWAPQESTTPMLNSDGTVNGDAYMGSPKRPGIRKTDTNINNPGDPDDKEDDGNTHLGDGLLALMFLACMYALMRVVLNRKRALNG